MQPAIIASDTVRNVHPGGVDQLKFDGMFTMAKQFPLQKTIPICRSYYSNNRTRRQI